MSQRFKKRRICGAQKVNSTTQLSYFELPLNVVLKPTLASGTVLISRGPYVTYVILGNFDQSPGSGQRIKFKNTVKATDPSEPYLKALDGGINLLAGYELKNGLSFQLNGQMGMLEINPNYENDPTDKSSYRTVGFGVSLGYRFHSKK